MAKEKYEYIRKRFTYEGHQYSVRGLTEEDCIRKKLELIKQLDEGVPVKQNSAKRNQDKLLSGDITVKEFGKLWLENYIQPKERQSGKDKSKNTISPKSFRMYQQQLENHIYPAIGSMKIKKVNDTNCQKILNDETKEGLSFSTVSKTKIVLNAMFKQALKSRIIKFNPADDLTVSAEKGEGRRSLTSYERQILLEVAKEENSKNDVGLWIRFLLNTGLRPSESAPLQKRDINLTDRTVSIFKDLESGSENIISTPKTSAGIRIVPITDNDLFSDLEEVLSLKNEDDFVFTQNDGKTMLSETSIQKRWKSFKRKMDLKMGAKHTNKGHIYDAKTDFDEYGVPLYPDENGNAIDGHVIADDLVLYCLRHTYATDLQRAGISLNQAKTLMGHSDVTTTANIYQHTDIDDIIKIGEQLRKYHSENEVKKGAI